VRARRQFCGDPQQMERRRAQPRSTEGRRGTREAWPPPGCATQTSTWSPVTMVLDPATSEAFGFRQLPLIGATRVAGEVLEVGQT